MTSGLRLEHEWFPRRVPSNVSIGEGSFLHSSFAFVRYKSELPVGVSIGDHTAVYQAAMFELGPEGRVAIGDYCMIWGSMFCANSHVSVGSHVLLSGECYVSDADAPVPPGDPSYRAAPSPEVTVEIGDNCWIGVRCTLLRGARLGTGVIVGAGTVVDFEVPDFAIVAGNPARIVGWAKPSDRL